MAARVCLFLLISLMGISIATEFPPELIVWNVGQGQWATIIDENGCWHLDMGGEFAPWRKIMQKCRSRPNIVSLSHWDMDHIGFAARARSNLPNICLLNAPLGPSSERKEAMISRLRKCKDPSPYVQWSDPEGKTANAKSWVVLWRRVLAPGDSPIAEEHKWVHHLAGLEQTRILILGHHGSRTSSSADLLGRLPHLQQAVSSARRRRYGHPHPEVVRRLAGLHIPLLLTEEWGNIHFSLW